MAMNDFMVLFTGIAAALGAGLSIWNFIQSPSKSNADAIDKVVAKLTDHDRRIQAVENEQRHQPSKDDFHELKLAIVGLKGTVDTLTFKVGAVDQTVAKIDTYLRKDDPK